MKNVILVFPHKHSNVDMFLSTFYFHFYWQKDDINSLYYVFQPKLKELVILINKPETFI